MNNRNISMLCDFYEFTMAYGYFKKGMHTRNAYYDVFFRNVPDNGGFAIAAGLDQIIDFIDNFSFSDEDIGYLRSKKCFDEDFLGYLRNLRFTGDIYAVPEGTPVFPNEPILTVKAPCIEAQLIETAILLALNHQSLIATKANRIVRAADGRVILEFGSRRAPGIDGALQGARAAYIGGCAGTSCTLTEIDYGIPAGGTMAHSWVQSFDSEYDAFKAYCELFPNSATLLVDTYNTLKSGVPNAIRAFREVLLPRGITSCAIRIDSGDIAYLSKKVRTMLDEAGFSECKIVATNSLDEYIIRDLILQGAKVDIFGVGERLITAKSDPVFGGVYKLVAIETKDGAVIPKIKKSESVSKITTPHYKKLYRYYDLGSGKALADEICAFDEVVDENLPRTIFDPFETWKTKTLTNFRAKVLQVPVFHCGKLIYDSPGIHDIKSYCAAQTALLWDEVKRFENPHVYYVDLSKKLWDIKQELLR